MASSRNPFREIEQFFDRLSDQFEGVTGDFQWEGPGGLTLDTGSLTVDVVERPEEFVVMAELPGFGNDDVQVYVTDDTCRIVGSTETTTETGDEHYIRRERSRRSVNRSISLPAGVAEDATEAELEDGILTVTLPKVEPGAEERRIEIS
jgi:HSP20 family protein